MVLLYSLAVVYVVGFALTPAMSSAARGAANKQSLVGNWRGGMTSATNIEWEVTDKA